MPAIAWGVSRAPCHLSPLLVARSPPWSQIIDASTYQAWPGRYSAMNLELPLLAAASFWPSWTHWSIEVGALHHEAVGRVEGHRELLAVPLARFGHALEPVLVAEVGDLVREVEQAAGSGELGALGVAQLDHVGRGVAGEGGGELVLDAVPLLDLVAHGGAGVRGLELRVQVRDELLGRGAVHQPHREGLAPTTCLRLLRATAGAGAAGNDQRRDHRDRGNVASFHGKSSSRPVHRGPRCDPPRLPGPSGTAAGKPVVERETLHRSWR